MVRGRGSFSFSLLLSIKLAGKLYYNYYKTAVVWKCVLKSVVHFENPLIDIVGFGGNPCKWAADKCPTRPADQISSWGERGERKEREEGERDPLTIECSLLRSSRKGNKTPRPPPVGSPFARGTNSQFFAKGPYQSVRLKRERERERRERRPLVQKRRRTRSGRRKEEGGLGATHILRV